MTNTQELKPCPFCGAEVIYNEGNIYGNIECSTPSCLMEKAGALGFTKELKSQMVRLWNTRASLAAPKVPDGWKLVPIEPTQQMFDWAAESLDDPYNEPGLRLMWKAMIAAAQGGADA